MRLPSGGRLLDSIVRGRAWIPVLGVLLVGIVGMRVEVLKLGSSVGTEMQQASQLQSSNAVMLKEVSALSGDQRIEQLAAKRGMVMPGPLDIHFVHSSQSANVNKAIGDITKPSPTTFLADLATEREQDGESADAAAKTSAVGILGGANLSGASNSSLTPTSAEQGVTTSTLVPTDSASATAGDATVDTTAGTSADTTTETPAATDTQGTSLSDTASADSSTPGTDGTTDITPPPATSTVTNGAAGLAG